MSLDIKKLTSSTNFKEWGMIAVAVKRGCDQEAEMNPWQKPPKLVYTSPPSSSGHGSRRASLFKLWGHIDPHMLTQNYAHNEHCLLKKIDEHSPCFTATLPGVQPTSDSVKWRYDSSATYTTFKLNANSVSSYVTQATFFLWITRLLVFFFFLKIPWDLGLGLWPWSTVRSHPGKGMTWPESNSSSKSTWKDAFFEGKIMFKAYFSQILIVSLREKCSVFFPWNLVD